MHGEYKVHVGKRRTRRRTRVWIWLLLLLTAAAACAAWAVSGDKAAVRLPTRTDRENIQTDFHVDMDELGRECDEAGGGFEPDEDELAQLRETEEKNPKYKDKIDFFTDHVSAYDETALRTLILSPEKIDFVLLEPFAESTPSGQWKAELRRGEVPYFIQYDSRWAFHEYGSSCMGNTACGPTCLAMAAAGLAGDETCTPDVVSDYAQDTGYYVEGSGTSWELFTSGAGHFGLRGEIIDTDEDTMKEKLRDGCVLIASLTPGDFTMGGHFIVIYGTGIGGFKIYDPSSIARSGRTWSFSRLQGQTAQIWSMSAA